MYYSSSGSYHIEETENGLFLITDKDWRWLVTDDDHFEPGETGLYYLDRTSKPPCIITDKNRIFYITNSKLPNELASIDSIPQPKKDPSKRPIAKEPPKKQPAQSQVNIFQQVVDAAIKDGYVQKTQLDDTWVSVWVRPKFHWLDHDTKRLTAVAFLEWAKQQKPGIKIVFLFDSRDNRRLGRYVEGLGLKLKRPE